MSLLWHTCLEIPISCRFLCLWDICSVTTEDLYGSSWDMCVIHMCSRNHKYDHFESLVRWDPTEWNCSRFMLLLWWNTLSKIILGEDRVYFCLQFHIIVCLWGKARRHTRQELGGKPSCYPTHYQPRGAFHNQRRYSRKRGECGLLATRWAYAQLAFLYRTGSWAQGL